MKNFNGPAKFRWRGFFFAESMLRPELEKMRWLFVIYWIYRIARITQGSTNAMSRAVIPGLSRFLT